MHLLNVSRLALALLAAAGTLACAPASKPPTLSLHLVAAPADYLEVNVHVREVHLDGPSGWTTVALPDVTLNLARLTGGAAAELVERTMVPAGAYRALRLVLGAAASVRLRDGSLHALALPATLRHGVEVPLGVVARPGAAEELVVDLDVGRSVRRVAAAGGADQFVLQPQVRSVDRLAREDGAAGDGGEG